MRFNDRNKLWRFFQVTVVVELSQHVLDSCQGVGELASVERLDGRLDPLKQIRRQSFVVSNHLIILTTLVDHLAQQMQHTAGIADSL